MYWWQNNIIFIYLYTGQSWVPVREDHAEKHRQRVIYGDELGRAIRREERFQKVVSKSADF